MLAPRKSHEDHPVNAFTHDVEEVKDYQIIGGLGQKSDLIVSKSVFPAFESDREARCRLHLGLYLIRIKARRSILDAVNTGITIKGIGNIDSLPVPKSADLLTQSGDFVAGQVGMGGIIGLASGAYRRFNGLEDQETKIFNLRSQDKVPRGNLRITNRYLSRLNGLRKTLIPPHFLESLETEISGVLFSEILVHFTAEEVNQILADSSNVNRAYKAPRLVIRMNFPYDQLDSIGNRPEALMTSSFDNEADTQTPPETYYSEVRIPRGRYDKTESAKDIFTVLIAEKLKVSPQKIVNFWPDSQQAYPPNQEGNFYLEKITLEGIDFVVLLQA